MDQVAEFGTHPGLAGASRFVCALGRSARAGQSVGALRRAVIAAVSRGSAARAGALFGAIPTFNCRWCVDKTEAVAAVVW